MNKFTSPQPDPAAKSIGSQFLPEAGEKTKISMIMFRYLGLRYLVFFFFCVIGFASLFFIGELLDRLRDFLEAEAGFRQIASYFLHRQTVHFPHVLPMSLLLSISYVLNSLARNHEITAIRASGISIIQFCLPVWLIAALSGVLLFWINETVAPAHADKAEIIRNEILTGKEQVAEQEQARLAFRNHQKNRYWFFENFNRQGVQEGVSIKQYDPETHILLWEIRAEKASRINGQWLFQNGFRFDYEAGDPLPSEEKRFTEYQLDTLEETPQRIFSRLSPAEEMNLRQIILFLRQEKGAAPSTRRIFQTLGWHRVALPFACIMAALLGVGMSTGKGRAGALRGFASAVGLIVLYYIFSQFFLVLGKHGLLPPLIAGALPTFGFVAYGAGLVYRRR